MRRLVLAGLAVAALTGNAVAAEEPDWLQLGDGVPTAGRSLGPLSMHLAMRRVLGEPAPVLTIRERGETVITMVGEASGFDVPQGLAAFLDMDPTATGPEVAFVSYSGGAHCCTTVRIARRDAPMRWSEISMGSWDGAGPEILQDADADGVFELVTVDNAFLYVFDCYACSEAPLVVLSLSNGTVVDVSAEERFLPLHRRWLAEIEARAAEAGPVDRPPGFWAGWIAAKVRVGESAEAWATFERDYRPDPDDDLVDCTVDADPCPPEATIRTPFPQALRRFLEDAGYAGGT